MREIDVERLLLLAQPVVVVIAAFAYVFIKVRFSH